MTVLDGDASAGIATARPLVLTVASTRRLRRTLAFGLAACLLVAALWSLQGQGERKANPSPYNGHRLGLAALPLLARGPVSSALGAKDPAYRIRERAGMLRTVNPTQGVTASFTSSGAAVAAGATRVGLDLQAMGRGSTLGQVGRAIPLLQSGKVLYRHAGITEWYANGPLGVEQGFTVPRASVLRGSGELTLELGLAGNSTAALASGGRAVVFEHKGSPRLQYTGLAATDATGRALRATLALSHGRLYIRVDDRGARGPIRIDPFLQTAELTGSAPVNGDKMGWSVALAEGTIAVAAPGRNGRRGAIDIFEEPASGWANATENAQLTATGAAEFDELGYSLAMSGKTIVAGAPFRKVGSNIWQGVVYVFVKPNSGWVNATQTATLSASDGAEADRLGYSVAISGTTIVAGAPYHKVGSVTGAGAAYVYSMPGPGWTNASQTAELTSSSSVTQHLGWSVATTGEAAAAGAPGTETAESAEVFTRPGASWSNEHQAAELHASGGTSNNDFGYSIAMSPQTVVVGAPFQHGFYEYQGAAYVYVKPGGGWANATQNAQLTPSDPTNWYEGFGNSVAISGTTVAVGDPWHREGIGAVYIYDEPGGGWKDANQNVELSTSDGAGGDRLAIGVPGVALSEGVLVAGAPYHTVGSTKNPGTAYVFPEVSPPGVTTEAASSLTHVTAVLNGSVDPNGSNVTSCLFEYGTTAAYGSTAACSPSPGAGRSAVHVSASLAGLTAGTEYHFRLVASNPAGGPVDGSDLTFHTTSGPAVVDLADEHGVPVGNGAQEYLYLSYNYPAVGSSCEGSEAESKVVKNLVPTVKLTGTNIDLEEKICFNPQGVTGGAMFVKSVSISAKGAIKLTGVETVGATSQCAYELKSIKGTVPLPAYFSPLTISGTSHRQKGSSASCAKTTPVEASIYLFNEFEEALSASLA